MTDDPSVPPREAFLPDLDHLWLRTLKWQPDRDQQDLLQQMYVGILEGNRRLNLTRIVEPIAFWEKHIWDSLAGVTPLELAGSVQEATAIDIGTGGGFPGLPVAIAFPNLKVTLVDSTRKKTLFLDRLLAELELPNATTLTGRAEQLGKHPPHRQAYDLALIRAVGTVPVCANYALPFLRSGGMAVLYRGHWTQDDLAALQRVADKQGATISSIERFTSPISRSIRHCVYLGKV